MTSYQVARLFEYLLYSVKEKKNLLSIVDDICISTYAYVFLLTTYLHVFTPLKKSCHNKYFTRLNLQYLFTQPRPYSIAY